MAVAFLPSTPIGDEWVSCFNFMKRLGFGAKFYGKQVPLWVNLLTYAAVSMLAYLFTNIEDSPLKSAEVKEWLSYLAPVALPLLVMMRDMIGLKSLNDVGEEKGKKKNP